MSALPDRIGHRTVFLLSWPILVSMLSYTAMTVSDSLFVARLGTAPLAAMGLAACALHLLSAFPVGLLGGARVQIAQASGAENHTKARQLAWQGWWLAVGMGLLILPMIPLAPYMITPFGGDESIRIYAIPYLTVRLGNTPLVFLVFALHAWFQGRGDTRTPMVGSLIGNATNIVLDPILIFGWFGAPELGVEGAAWATVVAWSVQLLILVPLAVAPLWRHRIGIRGSLLRAVCHTGLPMGTNYALDVAAFAIFAALLANVGEAHLAAHVIVVRILMVSFLPGHAIGEAAGVLVGQSLGAGRPEAARQAWMAATTQAVGFMLTLGVVFLLVPGPLVAFFGADTEVTRIAIDVLGLAALVQVFDAAAMVAIGSLNGAGDTRFTMVTSLMASWFVKVPVSVACVLWAGLGAYGAWVGIAVEIIVLAMASLARIRGTAWLAHAEPAACKMAA